MSQQQQGTTNQLLALPGLSDTGDAGDQGMLPPPPPPWWRTRGGIIGIAIALLIILLGGILFAILNRPKPVTYETQPVTTGNLSQTISATGPLQAGVYNLVFSGSAGSGIIDAIDVKVGQSVKKGQVLAQLDKTALQDAVNKDQAALTSAQSNLNSAMQSLAQAQASASAGNSSAQTGVSNAQSNKTSVQSQGSASVAQAQQTLASDQKALAAAQRSGQASINQAQAALNSAQTNLNHARTLANAQIAAAATTRTQADAACNATPAPNPGLSACLQAAQNAYNQTVAQANANVATAQATVTSDQQALNVARATANANITAAQTKVSDDQQALALAQANAAANNTTAQNQINTAQGQLGVTQQQGNTSIVSAQSQVIADQGIVKQDQQQLITDQDNLANATLKAPHSGTVTVINGSVGSTPGIPPSGTGSSAASSNTFIQIVDSSALQVVADVNEADTANLQVGDPAVFTVSAFGTRQFPGTVTAISPNGAVTSNVTTYPVYIDIDMTQLHGARLLPGMTANVTVTVLQRNNVLLVPISAVDFARNASSAVPPPGTPRAISPSEGAAALEQRNLEIQNPNITSDNPAPDYVLEQGKSGQILARPIVVGLSDGTNYEVLQGLIEGETIIVGVQGSGVGNFTGGAGGGGGGGGSGSGSSSSGKGG
jgi:HlyD family secretion protein